MSPSVAVASGEEPIVYETLGMVSLHSELEMAEETTRFFEARAEVLACLRNAEYSGNHTGNGTGGMTSGHTDGIVFLHPDTEYWMSRAEEMRVTPMSVRDRTELMSMYRHLARCPDRHCKRPEWTPHASLYNALKRCKFMGRKNLIP